MQSTEYRVSTVSVAGTEQLHAWSSGSVDENRYVSPPPPIVRYINASENKLPQKLQFWGKRTWSILFGSKSREGTNELTLGPLPAYFSRTTSRGDNGELLFPSLETSLTIEIIPVSIKLHYYTEEGQGQESTLRVLPDNDVITLKATKGLFLLLIAGNIRSQEKVHGVMYLLARNIQREMLWLLSKGTDLL